MPPSGDLSLSPKEEMFVGVFESLGFENPSLAVIYTSVAVDRTSCALFTNVGASAFEAVSLMSDELSAELTSSKPKIPVKSTITLRVIEFTSLGPATQEFSSTTDGILGALLKVAPG